MGRRLLANKPTGTLTSRAAARVVGVPFRSLMRWAQDGLLRPVSYRSRGRWGEAVAWSVVDLIEAKAIASLRSEGLPLQRVRKAVWEIRKSGRELAGVQLFTDSKNCYLVFDQDRLMDLIAQPGQFAVYPLGDWAELVERRFKRELRKAS